MAFKGIKGISVFLILMIIAEVNMILALRMKIMLIMKRRWSTPVAMRRRGKR